MQAIHPKSQPSKYYPARGLIMAYGKDDHQKRWAYGLFPATPSRLSVISPILMIFFPYQPMGLLAEYTAEVQFRRIIAETGANIQYQNLRKLNEIIGSRVPHFRTNSTGDCIFQNTYRHHKN